MWRRRIINLTVVSMTADGVCWVMAWQKASNSNCEPTGGEGIIRPASDGACAANQQQVTAKTPCLVWRITAYIY